MKSVSAELSIRMMFIIVLKRSILVIGAQYSLSYKEEKLIDIVRWAYEGEFVIPDFQRNFVWNRQDIEELVKSILENIFVGVFLVQRVDPRDPPFKVIPVKGAKDINTRVVNMNLILDGQQRITSLLYALYAPDYPLRNTAYRHFFFLDLKSLAKGDVEKGVFSLSVNDRRLKGVLGGSKRFNLEELKKRKWLPLKFLSGSESEFGDLWYDQFRPLFSSSEDARNVKSVITRIFQYAVPVFYLDRARPEDVIVLFERLNKTGIRLSLYDLVVARVYKFIKLKDRWVEAYELNSNIRKLAEDVENTNIPFLIIQALALSKGLGVRYGDIIRIDEHVLNEASWNRAVNVLETRVLEMVFDTGHYGIVGPKWIPYLPMISVMLAVFLKVDHPSENKLDKWYWSSVFSERYSGSTNSVMKQDFDQLCSWLEGDSIVLDAVEDLRRQIKTGTLGLVRVNRFANVSTKGYLICFSERALTIFTTLVQTFDTIRSSWKTIIFFRKRS